MARGRCSRPPSGRSSRSSRDDWDSIRRTRCAGSPPGSRQSHRGTGCLGVSVVFPAPGGPVTSTTNGSCPNLGIDLDTSDERKRGSRRNRSVSIRNGIGEKVMGYGDRRTRYSGTRAFADRCVWITAVPRRGPRSSRRRCDTLSRAVSDAARTGALLDPIPTESLGRLRNQPGDSPGPDPDAARMR